MGDMTIKIPDDIEEALERSFPGEDKATVLFRLVRERLSQADQDVVKEAERKKRFEAALEALRKLPSLGHISDDEIRRLRQEGRP